MEIAFDVVFALFIVLIVGLAVIAVRWGVRRDRRDREVRNKALRTGAEGPSRKQ